MRSFRGKVLAAILLTTLVTASAIALVFYSKSAKTTEENYIVSLRQRQQQLVESLEQMMEMVSQITINTSCDEELQTILTSYLEEETEGKLSDMGEILKEYGQRDKSLASIYLLIPERNILVTSQDYPVYRKKIEESKIDQAARAQETEAGPVILEDQAYEGSQVVSYVEAVKDDEGRVLAYVQANIEERRLYYDYIAKTEENMVEQSVLLDKEGRGLASMEDEAGFLGSSYGLDSPYGSWLQGDRSWGKSQQYLYVHSRGSFSGCSILTVVRRAAVLEDIIGLRNDILGVLGIFLLLSIFPAMYLTQVVYRPLNKLTIAMNEVSEGELETRAEVISRDEIGALTENFNQMLDRIEDLIRQVIYEEEQKKDAELEALQYQITPHFMYNTLNSIKFAALLRGEKELGGLIGEFVELLQASISKKGAFLSVAEEVHILKNYIHLQEFRSGGQYCFTYKIAPQAENCQVPRLILQPLVENAILHGIDLKQSEGMLAIEAEVSGDQLYLRVSDNGRGMTEEQISQLLNGEKRKEKGFTPVGIPNIRDRLQLYYGGRAGLSFESKEQGTSAVIHLPAIWEEE